MDTWAGNNHDPVTLHKYLYAGNNPVTYYDPSGNMFAIGGIVDIGFSMNFSATIRTTSTAAARNQFQRILFGRPPGDLGIVGEFILDNAINAVLDIVGMDFANKGAAGTKAHSNLEKRLSNYKPIAGITIEPEVFFDEDGGETEYKRQKGSIGIDILIKRKGKAVLGLDLKIGKGFSKKRIRSLKKRAGVPIVQIFIGVK